MKKSMLILLTSVITLFSYGCSKPKPNPTPDPPGPDPTTSFEVTWELGNGVIEKETYNEGETPSYKKIIDYKEGHNEDYGYLFKSWDKPFEPITSNTTYTAIYDTEESCVATSFILMTLQKKNVDHCEFHYTGHLKEVDWGDGSARDQLNTHTYPEKDSQTYPVKIFGNITSISFADENGVYGNSNLAIRCITLASTITDLPNNAFKGCTYANSVFIGKNVQHVGKNAFDNLRSTADDTCLIYTQTGISTTGWDTNWNPKGYRVVENINRMGLAEDESNPNNYFGYLVQQQGQEEYLAISSYYDKRGYSALTSITIPDKIDGMYVNSIIYSPFKFFTNLTTFNIEASRLYYIGEEGLQLGKMSTLSLPNTLTIIGYRAFYYCNSLTTLNLNDNNSLTTIGEEAFYQTTISNEFKMPNTVNYIGPNAFNFSHSVKITNLENTQIAELFNGTFYQCWGIESIGLPTTLKVIHSGAFNNCKNLASIDASKYTSVENIPTCENDAFKDAKSDAVVICNKAFDDAKEAMKAFVANGWPTSFTYQLESEI